MLKHFWISALAAALFGPFLASAQNAGEVARAQSGEGCPNCNLFQADLAYTEMKNISFQGARLRQSDMSLAVMDRVNFKNANLSIANMYGGRFQGADFSNTDLKNATMVGAWFGRAQFKGADLAGANISGADLKTAQGLTQTMLNTACGDDSTQLPTGLFVPQCRP